MLTPRPQRDDLIDLVVMSDGFIIQGGFAIGWSEVSRVNAVRVAKRQRRTRTLAIRVDIHLPDCTATLQRATTRAQKRALRGDVGRRSGRAQALLDLRTAEEAQQLLDTLRRECRRHDVPFAETTEPAGW